MTPLATAPAAQADMDWLGDLVHPGDISSEAGLFAPPDDVLDLSEVFNQSIYIPLHDGIEAWINSPIGLLIAGLINGLTGQYLIGDGAAGTALHPDGGDGGLLFGDGGNGWGYSGSGGNAGWLFGDGGHAGAAANPHAGLQPLAYSAAASAGSDVGAGDGDAGSDSGGLGGDDDESGSNTDDASTEQAPIDGAPGHGGNSALLFGNGGNGTDGGVGQFGGNGGRGGDGGNGGFFFGSGGNGGNGGVGGAGTAMHLDGGRGGAGGDGGYGGIVFGDGGRGGNGGAGGAGAGAEGGNGGNGGSGGSGGDGALFFGDGGYGGNAGVGGPAGVDGVPGEDGFAGGPGSGSVFGTAGESGSGRLPGGGDTSGGDTDGGSGDDGTGGGSGDDSTDGGSGDEDTGGGSGDDSTDGGSGDEDTGGGSGDEDTGGGSGDDGTDANFGGIDPGPSATWPTLPNPDTMAATDWYKSYLDIYDNEMSTLTAKADASFLDWYHWYHQITFTNFVNSTAAYLEQQYGDGIAERYTTESLAWYHFLYSEVFWPELTAEVTESNVTPDQILMIYYPSSAPGLWIQANLEYSDWLTPNVPDDVTNYAYSHLSDEQLNLFNLDYNTILGVQANLALAWIPIQARELLQEAQTSEPDGFGVNSWAYLDPNYLKPENPQSFGDWISYPAKYVLFKLDEMVRDANNAITQGNVDKSTNPIIVTGRSLYGLGKAIGDGVDAIANLFR